MMLFRKNNSALSLITIGALIIILLTVLYIVIAVTMNKTPICPVAEQHQLSGILRGFNKNGSFYDVTVGNETFVFCYILEESYLERFIGKPVVIRYCENRNKYRDRVLCFDMVSCILCAEVET
jgi:hypothetical protein